MHNNTKNILKLLRHSKDIDSFLEYAKVFDKLINEKSFFFASQMEGKQCPDDCKQDSYVVAGDEVLIGKSCGEL